ncbi:MAG: sigma-70 family RNA polymerase sigma factor [Planctomyces sp.]|nr:sigma-70 family RNA polymerase sigma factor [Planctomyces sp.]
MVEEIPETRDSLLIRVADARDQVAWELFARLYRPVVYNVARMRGLQDADAQDVAQQVLIAVSRALPSWQRLNGATRFRHWLCRIARNATINALTRQPRDRAAGGESDLPDAIFREADTDLDSQLEREYRRQLFRRAAEVVRSRTDESTWQAFAMTMIDGIPIAEAAKRLQRSEAVVYAARSRIMRRLRDVVKELEEESDESSS